jgi:hypothetical protein
MGTSYPTKMVLAFRSGDMCAFPLCGNRLTLDGQQADATIIGEAAHIAGEKPDAARYDPTMTDEQRNHYENLVYLCRNHHVQIDKQRKDFSVESIQNFKREHEDTVRVAMTEAFASVGFLELEEATRWIATIQPTSLQGDFSLLPPEAKLKKNDLGNLSRHVITMGLGVVHHVRSYVESVSQVDDEFPRRLKAGFLEEYNRLIKEGYSGDALFELMCAFAQRGFGAQAEKSAGLAVLVYLFEACEVFEK